MTDSIRFLKRDLSVIDGVAIYNTSSKSYLYQDKDVKPLGMLDSICATGAIDSFDFMYVDSGADSYFVQSFNNHLTIILLKQKSDFNKVLFEINVRNFCKNHIDA